MTPANIAARNLINAAIRSLNGLSRPSKARNVRLLYKRGETSSSFTIRNATPEDIPALAALHVKAWNETYGKMRHPPTVQVREWQWNEQFNVTDGSWCCFVVEDSKGALIGFAKGKPFEADELPGYEGQLDKIYLLRAYQRLGLGRRLMGHVVQWFLNRGILSMVLFGIPQNPSCRFHEALGGKKLFSRKGEFHGGYGWRDLGALAAICPAE